MNLELPWLLLLLPLAILPVLKLRQSALDIPSNYFLPEDPLGLWCDRLWRILSVLSIIILIIALARPGLSKTTVERSGRGAEISILMDRSSSMDAAIRRNAPEPGRAAQATQSKNEVVRHALSELLALRPENRYALTLFNAAAIRVAPFTDDVEIVRAGLAASGVGRGPSETHMGMALLAAIDAFEGRRFSGSRAILLVSDGGARLSELEQRLIREGLQRHRVSLYFVYIQSSPNSPDLERVGLQSDSTVEEVALHVFFQGLDVPYRVFQADDPESMAAAVAEIDKQQNLPLSYLERVPRIDYSKHALAMAAIGTLLLAGMSIFRLERWA